MGLNILKMDTADYSKVWALQKEIVDGKINGETADTILILEHNPVITLGRNADRKNILAEKAELAGTDILEVDRGGDVTVHYPGQAVVYLIMDLKKSKCDLHWYLRKLEQALIDSLASYGIQSHRRDSLTGVWVGEEKIASIGIGVRNWITYHGISLNVKARLEYFSLICPCGIKGVKMTSMENVLNRNLDIKEVKNNLADFFVRAFFAEQKGEIS